MVIVMEPNASESSVQTIIDKLNAYGFDVHRSTGIEQTVLGAIGVKPDFDIRHIKVLDKVADVYRVTEPYKFASRTWKQQNSVIPCNGVDVGSNELIIMAGPCSVESEEQIFACAEVVAKTGGQFLRGGAFKPRSSPYAFQGLGEAGLKMMRAAADHYGLKVVTEVMDAEQLELVDAYTDMLQLGARNMQNFSLLKVLGSTQTPVLLKRGLSSTIEEWLMSAEYIIANGNPNVVFCERGIRTFETATRNTLDLSAVPVIKKKSHLPIIVDPSHGVGIRDKIAPMALAGVAAGADGLMIEFHPDPPKAKSDGPQSLYFDQFEALMGKIRAIAEVVGKTLPEKATV
jgi:3-deoxy-7-phosphoheptulonate synthase